MRLYLRVVPLLDTNIAEHWITQLQETGLNFYDVELFFLFSKFQKQYQVYLYAWYLLGHYIFCKYFHNLHLVPLNFLFNHFPVVSSLWLCLFLNLGSNLINSYVTSQYMFIFRMGIFSINRVCFFVIFRFVSDLFQLSFPCKSRGTNVLKHVNFISMVIKRNLSQGTTSFLYSFTYSLSLKSGWLLLLWIE